MNKKLMVWIVLVACFATSCATKFEQGLSYYNKGQYAQAIAAYQEAIQQNPNDYKSYTNLGAVYDKVKQYNKAVESYTMAIKIEPRSSLAYYNLGLVYSIMYRYTDAINVLNIYLNLARDIPEQRDLVGNAVYLLSTAEIQRQRAAEQRAAEQRAAEAIVYLMIMNMSAEQHAAEQRAADEEKSNAQPPISRPSPAEKSGPTQADVQAIKNLAVQFSRAYLACRRESNRKSCIALKVGVGMRGDIIPLVCAHPDYVGKFLGQEKVANLLSVLSWRQ